VVEVRIDGDDWAVASGTTAWLWSWNTELVDDGGHTISARGTDGGGRTGPVDTLNVTVRNSVGSPPQVEGVENMRVSVGKEVRIQIVATDLDGDALTYNDDTDLFDVDPTTGLISFTPTDDQVGTWTVNVFVSDSGHQTKTTFIITVEPKEEGEGILGLLSITTVMSIILLVFLVAVVVALGLRRSRRSRRLSDIPRTRRSGGDAP
jgi:heme/copper-type cytochrome/quinol oxidase subunit 2